jgi:hypothetical protein
MDKLGQLFLTISALEKLIDSDFSWHFLIIYNYYFSNKDFENNTSQVKKLSSKQRVVDVLIKTSYENIILESTEDKNLETIKKTTTFDL